MNANKLIVAGPEQKYLERLVQFTMRSTADGKWKIKSFTQKEHLDQWIKAAESYDVLAVDARWVEEGEWLAPEGAVLLHPTRADEAEKQGRRWQVVRKYQPIPHLLTALSEAGSGRAGTASLQLTRQERGCELIALYSPVGGSGKTTVAMHLLHNVLPRKDKTLYMNLELFQANPLFPHTKDADSTGELLYRIKTNSDDTQQHFEQAVRYDAARQIYYLPSFWHVKNRLELGGVETESLLELALQSGRYDRVVLDLDSAPHESTFAALKKSDRVLWLMLDDERCLVKSRLAMDAFSTWVDEAHTAAWKSKCHFILNKFTGEAVHDFSAHGMPISGTLPYIPQWKTVRNPKDWLKAGLFSQALARLIATSPFDNRGEQLDRTKTG